MILFFYDFKCDKLFAAHHSIRSGTYLYIHIALIVGFSRSLDSMLIVKKLLCPTGIVFHITNTKVEKLFFYS